MAEHGHGAVETAAEREQTLAALVRRRDVLARHLARVVGSPYMYYADDLKEAAWLSSIIDSMAPAPAFATPEEGRNDG